MQSIYEDPCVKHVFADARALQEELCGALQCMIASSEFEEAPGLVLVARAFNHLMRTTLDALPVARDTVTAPCAGVGSPHHMDIMHAAILTTTINAGGAPAAGSDRIMKIP